MNGEDSSTSSNRQSSVGRYERLENTSGMTNSTFNAATFNRSSDQVEMEGLVFNEKLQSKKYFSFLKRIILVSTISFIVFVTIDIAINISIISRLTGQVPDKALQPKDGDNADHQFSFLLNSHRDWSWKKVMVVGGYPAYNDVEVIDLDNMDAQCTKPDNIPLTRGSTGTFINGSAFVCEDTQDCYLYNKDQSRSLGSLLYM